jgi:hypothetical protein
MGQGLGGVKTSGRDEPIGAVIHICMERTQRNSPCSYLYLKLAKMPCFPYYLLGFFLLQNWRTGSAGEREAEEVLAPVGG